MFDEQSNLGMKFEKCVQRYWFSIHYPTRRPRLISSGRFLYPTLFNQNLREFAAPFPFLPIGTSGLGPENVFFA